MPLSPSLSSPSDCSSLLPSLLATSETPPFGFRFTEAARSAMWPRRTPPTAPSFRENHDANRGLSRTASTSHTVLHPSLSPGTRGEPCEPPKFPRFAAHAGRSRGRRSTRSVDPRINGPVQTSPDLFLTTGSQINGSQQSSFPHTHLGRPGSARPESGRIQPICVFCLIHLFPVIFPVIHAVQFLFISGRSVFEKFLKLIL